MEQRTVSLDESRPLTPYMSLFAATDNVHVAHSMLWMKALTQNGVLFRSQLYPDESHALASVTRHLYQTMQEFLTDCFALDRRYDDVGLRRTRVL